VGGGGFGVGASASPKQRGADARVYRRLEASDERCCPVDTILTPPFRGARGFECFFDTTLVSQDGAMRACTYEVPGEEGARALVLCVDESLVHGALFLRALAWEPGGGRLLVREAAPDDDLAMYVLNVAGGEYTKSADQAKRTRIGGRADRYRGWDGDFILLEDATTPTARRGAGRRRRPAREVIARRPACPMPG
jgi:hypothetical protein